MSPGPARVGRARVVEERQGEEQALGLVCSGDVVVVEDGGHQRVLLRLLRLPQLVTVAARSCAERAAEVEQPLHLGQLVEPQSVIGRQFVHLLLDFWPRLPRIEVCT